MTADHTVRLYRMQARGHAVPAPVADWIAESDAYKAMVAATGRWFTDSLDEALWYEAEHPGGEIVFVDLPAEMAEHFRVSSIGRRDGHGSRDTPESPAAYSARQETEFFVSRKIADRARPLEDHDMEMGKRPAFG